jgi:hypothetical protein
VALKPTRPDVDTEEVAGHHHIAAGTVATGRRRGNVMDLNAYVNELTAGLIAAPSFVAAVRQMNRTADAVRVLVPLAGHDPQAAEALYRLAPGIR